MVASGCAESPTAINSGVSRWDTEENACLCEKRQQLLPIWATPAEAGGAAFDG